MLRNLKFIALVIGFGLILATKLKYQKRIANNPDKSTPYNKEEKTMLYTGYGFCALAILFVILWNQKRTRQSPLTFSIAFLTPSSGLVNTGTLQSFK